MQHPVGYVINPIAGRAELVDFFALVTNPKGWLFFWHTISSGFVTASFFILAISAWHLYRKQNLEVFKVSFKMAAVIGLISTLMVVIGGDTQGKYVKETQPMKMASIEALWKTEQPASFSLLTIGNLTGKEEVWSLRVPYLLSIIACNNTNCEVRGVNDIQAEYTQMYGPGDYVPLMVVTYWSFRFMLLSGLLMLLLSGLALWWALKGFPEKQLHWARWGIWMIFLPYIANSSGWILTETGRQPWIVQGLLLTKNGVSPTSTIGWMLVTVSGFTLLYAALMVADIYLLRKYAKAGPDAAMRESVDVEPSLVGSQD